MADGKQKAINRRKRSREKMKVKRLEKKEGVQLLYLTNEQAFPMLRSYLSAYQFAEIGEFFVKGFRNRIELKKMVDIIIDIHHQKKMEIHYVNHAGVWYFVDDDGLKELRKTTDTTEYRGGKVEYHKKEEEKEDET